MQQPFSKSILLRPFVKRFVGGETLEEALAALKNLKAQGFFTTLDFLGESVRNEKEAQAATEEYIQSLKALKKEGLDCNISVKLTQLGLRIDENFTFENFMKIAKAAFEVGGFVRIDMEDSPYTAQTLRLVARVHKHHANVGAVLQGMLRRTPEDLVEMLKEKIRIRLCKGAYKEPPSIAFPDKQDVNRQYVTLMKRLLTSGIYHGIATHDEKIIEEAKRFAIQENISKDAFEFQMLLGIRNRFAKRLVDEGWKVRIYVPYGDFWFPYMTRRLSERKENIWFVIKNLFRG